MSQSLLSSALLTDLYEITMGGAYFHNDLQEEASFELFVRDLPENRSYLIAAGLEQVVHFLENFHFEPEEVDYLRNQPVFKDVNPKFFDYLAGLRFEGSLHAVPEGAVVFAEEPLLRVTAPIIQAQLAETYLLSTLGFQTLVATKASRVVQAACADGKERSVVDFGSRRAHGPEAGVLAARASFIGGCAGTSNCYAGMRFGIPVFGTAAHSWTMAFPSEPEAFKAYHRAYPDSSTLLIDTYDTLEGARNAARLGKALKGVRLDSGDLLPLSRQVRRILDEAGCEASRIVASGNLNEYKIADLVAGGAPIDLFGVGTEMVTSSDAPKLEIVYKLVERIRAGRRLYTAKFSEEKVTLPGNKQIGRFSDAGGKMSRDRLLLEDEPVPLGARPLMVPILEAGKRVAALPSLGEIQSRARAQLQTLSDEYKHLEEAREFRPERSEALEALLRQVRTQRERKESVR